MTEQTVSGQKSQFQTDLQRFGHRRQKWGPSMAEHTDSVQKVNFRQNRNKNHYPYRTVCHTVQSPIPLQVNVQSRMSYRAERELKMKALKKQTKIRHMCGVGMWELSWELGIHSVLCFYI